MKNALDGIAEGFVDLDGEGFYAIPDVDRLRPFLMNVVSDGDRWMFVSSTGNLTAGRGDASSALFPYVTDDHLKRSAGVAGPVTAIRRAGAGVEETWTPFRGVLPPQGRRNLYKSVVGDQVIFEEVRPDLGLAFRYRWSSSDGFGFVRTATLTSIAGTATVHVVDGLVDILPHGVDPQLYRRMSNLTNAYKRSEVVAGEGRLAVLSLEAHIVDLPEPAEALRASSAWSVGLDGAAVGVTRETLEAFEAGQLAEPASLATGSPGAYLLSSAVEIGAGQSLTWSIVADVGQDQSDVADLRRFLRTEAEPMSAVMASVRGGTESLVAMMARGDGLQCTGDRVASAHQFANVTFNVMRGGIFASGYDVSTSDFAEFVALRSHGAADRHRLWLAGLPPVIGRGSLLDSAAEVGEPHLIRLVLEYLPLSFSRRHGDPSRPWNTFSIRVRDNAGEPLLHYEGNWRDIFQNWEALCLSFPEYLPSFVSVFVNASTPDGFNPYRITREGIDWEIPEPDDPWSNVGYWGDHQIVYLLRLLEGARRYLPGEMERMLGRAWFAYADVPYRLATYDEVLLDPKATIHFDDDAAQRSAARVADEGSDGRLLHDPDGRVQLVTLLEKLLVPALAKLSSYVPRGGIWMNTQRPEWNDANNALVGNGLSMVTLCHLRSYLIELSRLIADSGLAEAAVSVEVVEWLEAVTAALEENVDLVDGDVSDERRRHLMDELGRAFSTYRTRVYTEGLSAPIPLETAAVVRLGKAASRHLDDTIRHSRRADGLYHSYNVVDFGDSEATVGHLHEMLEGQVAVLSAGLLGAEERADVIDALFASALYVPRERSFLLYPARTLPSFLEKNVLPPTRLAANPLLLGMLEAGDTSVLRVDADGRHRFNPSFRSGADVAEALDRLSRRDEWRAQVAAHGARTLLDYEEVFGHHEFTGRSASMYGYEGIGSIYWHMVGKLLVAVQEAIMDGVADGAAAATVSRLIDGYWRIRSGLGFNKTAVEYGAFPIDPYSHTPADSGARQPGMTGHVKEELLTRMAEMAIRVEGGEIRFDALLLRSEELLDAVQSWNTIGLDGQRRTVELAAGSLGLTICQVPVVIALTDGPAEVTIAYLDGTERRLGGSHIDKETSRAIFARTGEVALVHALVTGASSPTV